MVRVKRGNVARKRRKKVLKRAKGFQGSLHRIFRTAKEFVTHAKKYSTRDRKNRKREFRALWIVRINAATKQAGMSYSRFINALKKANIKLDRKMLASIAADDPDTFSHIMKIAKGGK